MLKIITTILLFISTSVIYCQADYKSKSQTIIKAFLNEIANKKYDKAWEYYCPSHKYDMEAKRKTESFKEYAQQYGKIVNYKFKKTKEGTIMINGVPPTNEVNCLVYEVIYEKDTLNLTFGINKCNELGDLGIANQSMSSVKAKNAFKSMFEGKSTFENLKNSNFTVELKDYGLFTSSSMNSIVKSDTLTIKIGDEMGVLILFKDVKDDVEEVPYIVEWTAPKPIFENNSTKQTKKKVFKPIKADPNAAYVMYTSMLDYYKFEEEDELVTGKWTYKIFTKKGKEVFSKSFIIK